MIAGRRSELILADGIVYLRGKRNEIEREKLVFANALLHTAGVVGTSRENKQWETF